MSTLPAVAVALALTGCGGSGGNGNAGDQGTEDEWTDLAAQTGANAPVGSNPTVTSSSDDGRFTIESTTPGIPGKAVNGDPQQTASGLQYYVLSEGTGESPKSPTQYVKVNYTGYLPDGQQFDTSAGTPAIFRLDEVVSGFGEGLSLMKVGGARKLLIPGNLGFGPQAVPTRSGVTIPANSPLVFDVELVELVDFVSDPAEWPGQEVTSAWTMLESGVRYAQLNAGTGDAALVRESAAQMHIEGWLTTGDPFLNTRAPQAGPTTVYLPTLPPGWAEAMYGMKVGEKRKFVLPAEHGFGAQGDPQLRVPIGATVIADIELVAIDPYVALPDELPGETTTSAPVETENGVTYYVLAEGEGDAAANENSLVTIGMRGWLNDGSEFTAAAPNVPTDTLVRDMFPGLQEAVLGMTVGGKRKVIVPFEQGPGPGGLAPLIPPKSTVIFEIELTAIDRYESAPEVLPGAEVAGDPTEVESGVTYWVLQEGAGPEVVEDSAVQIRMDAYLNTGDEITPSDEPMFALRTQVMPGLADAILGAKVGEKRKVKIPWEHGAGEAGMRDPQGQVLVPPKAILIVDVEILDLDIYTDAPEQLPGEQPIGEPTTLESGVMVYDLKPGVGEAVTENVQTVQVKISTFRPDGQLVQGLSSPQQTAPMPFEIAPPGLKEGMIGMQVGGRRKIVIPWEHAYGLEGNIQRGAPAKTLLIIDVELAGIVPVAAPIPPVVPDGTSDAGDAGATGADDDADTSDSGDDSVDDAGGTGSGDG